MLKNKHYVSYGWVDIDTVSVTIVVFFCQANKFIHLFIQLLRAFTSRRRHA